MAAEKIFFHFFALSRLFSHRINCLSLSLSLSFFVSLLVVFRHDRKRAKGPWIAKDPKNVQTTKVKVQEQRLSWKVKNMKEHF